MHGTMRKIKIFFIDIDAFMMLSACPRSRSLFGLFCAAADQNRDQDTKKDTLPAVDGDVSIAPSGKGVPAEERGPATEDAGGGTPLHHACHAHGRIDEPRAAEGKARIPVSVGQKVRIGAAPHRVRI